MNSQAGVVYDLRQLVCIERIVDSMNKKPDLEDYNESRSKGGFHLIPEAGYLRISGPDQFAFLQRQTTNDMNLLKTGRALLTVLTNSAARILDVLYLLEKTTNQQQFASEAPDIELITLPGFTTSTYQYLKRRIFFMDKVTISDHSDEFTQINLITTKKNYIPDDLAELNVLEADQEVGITYQGIPLRIIRLNPAIGLGYLFIVPKTHQLDLVAWLQKWGFPKVSDTLYQILRIEAGLPQPGKELSDKYTPLEVGLSKAVSGNKGCYTGQEVIARQITYQKITQQISGISLDELTEEGSLIEVDGKPIGSLTSNTYSPHFGPIGLAVLKRPYHLAGVHINIGQVNGIVRNIPFSDS